ncbi:MULTISPECIES: MFS transporter [unclassified Mucilaginibacter]|uniref:MFS transporter n=1 Tax=unclassified Mucilaginibacter TaxID=2617802 RepID=UPI002AC9C082|nr:MULTISPECIES: MFS transporter [unclassified Mucilaginibacter]MEB0260615.1 MFS transporter [Mucilaginibacter sp. 10I4]MEB0299618.1 MFS transporter [Mucilaginibacter sp. 5C4]WPX22918.1 MFS transporter [Mucilaginibacter sp. 5C4]
MNTKRILWVLVFIAIINSMGFGIIIPLLYPYGKKFGVTEHTIGLLTAAYSIAQFFATPVLGSLSDRFGRKPLLVFSLIGTCASFIMFGLANSIIMLFAARILDGLTGGNISVAQAMVSDISSPKERAKNFGIIGSAFGFGFVIGPAIGGLLSKFGLKVPFYFAAGIAILGVLLTLFFLKETNKNKTGKSPFKKNSFSFVSLYTVLKMPVVGTAIFTGFLLTMAQFTMLIGFQTFSVDELKLNPTQIGLFYGGFGLSGILMQMMVPAVKKVISSQAIILLISTLFCLGMMILAGFATGIILFAVSIGIYGLFNGLRNPMLNAIIADRNEGNEKGEVMGVNQSYASIGQTLGPITAGLITAISIHSIFFLASFYILIALLFSIRLITKEKQS